MLQVLLVRVEPELVAIAFLDVFVGQPVLGVRLVENERMEHEVLDQDKLEQLTVLVLGFSFGSIAIMVVVLLLRGAN